MEGNEMGRTAGYQKRTQFVTPNADPFIDIDIYQSVV
jgi:hypothetical protein